MNPTNKTTPDLVPSTELIPTPESLLPANRSPFSRITGKQQVTCQDVESILKEQLSIVEGCRKTGAVADLRAGVLFHVYRTLKGLKGEAFWTNCEQVFGVSRGTINKKMRLALIWAKTSGASDDQILQLTNATDLSSTSPDTAVQLAFDFIGDKTITELYRQHKLIDPAPNGGDITRRDPETGKRLAQPRRTDAEIAQESFKLVSSLWWTDIQRNLKNALTEKLEETRLWDLLTDDQLTYLRGSLQDLDNGIITSQARRRLLKVKSN